MTAAFVEQRRAASCDRPLQHPAVDRVPRLSDGAVTFEIADDDADGLRGQQRNPREIGAGQARLSPEHSEHDELRRGHADVSQCPLRRQARRGLGLPQQIGEVALLAALAFARRRRADHGECGVLGELFPSAGTAF